MGLSKKLLDMRKILLFVTLVIAFVNLKSQSWTGDYITVRIKETAKNVSISDSMRVKYILVTKITSLPSASTNLKGAVTYYNDTFSLCNGISWQKVNSVDTLLSLATKYDLRLYPKLSDSTVKYTTPTQVKIITHDSIIANKHDSLIIGFGLNKIGVQKIKVDTGEMATNTALHDSSHILTLLINDKATRADTVGFKRINIQGSAGNGYIYFPPQSSSIGIPATGFNFSSDNLGRF